MDEEKKKLALSPLKCASQVQINNEENGYEENSSKLLCESSQYGEEAAIRSVAIIKKSQVEFPVSFRELQSNTDIKTPPSNWLRGQFSICFPNLTPKHSDFTSFIMGYQFPDCIGEVDIVSDAENIKKLLKMAYKPNTHLSMMVHRVGKTILIDEFDIYKYLLRRSQCEWKWLRKFFYEHVLESLARKEQNVLVRPNKSRDVVQSKNLLSKFLYHSIGEEKVELSTPEPVREEIPMSVRTISSPTKDSSLELPLEEHLPDPSVQPFTRNIIWNFEDLRMLIGTDLPIFGGRTHPCVSLRLKDMDKPINILTGIDYWLDNLMCNVPEVVMCYHQNGIVQKYELIKTEDLPHMSDSQFSPQLVRDIAHNILSFLKSKATKEGHTYWLFKGKDDDIVKLYDLTSLCNEDGLFESSTQTGAEGDDGEPADNPFTVPVAMLFYCVAKNMWSSKESTDKFPTIRALLDNALSLLRKDKYPKIFCHSHLILADLYLPQDIDPDSPRLFDVSEDEMEVTKSERTKEVLSTESKREGKKKKKKNSKKVAECNSINLATLCRRHGGKGGKHKASDPPKLSGNVYERCNSAMYHVISGLMYLGSCPNEVNLHPSSTNVEGESQTSSQIPDEPKMAKQFEPIPMPYEPLNKPHASSHDTETKKSISELSQPPSNSLGSLNKDGKKLNRHTSKAKESLCTSNKSQNVIVPKTILTGAVLNSHLKDASWIDKIRFKFLRKASLIYMTKGRIELNGCNYGLCLRSVKLSLRAWCGMLSILGPELEFPLPSQPLLLAGDAYYNLSKSWELAPSHIEEFNSLTKEQKQMNGLLEKLVPCEDSRLMIKMPCDSVEAMMLSYKSFETAIKATNSNPDFELKRRLAGICNELGCMYMNQADQMCQNLVGGIKSGGSLWEDSRRFIEKAFDIFREVGDNDNLALLHCNKGRYLRLYAFHSSSVNGQQVFTPVVKKIYEKAFDEYDQALSILNSKESVHTDVEESVVWEYSTTLFSYGTIIQDTPRDKDEANEENLTKYVSMIYNKCLKLCDTKSSGSREPLYQYRAAVIHVRLATMYHEKFRRSRDSKMKYLADIHYQKSAVQFLHLDSSPVDIFKVHLDNVVLLEDAIEGMRDHMTRWKSYLSILKLLTSCVNGLLLLQKQKEEKRKEAEETTKGTRKKGKGKKEKKKEETEVASEDAELLNSFLELLEKKLSSTLFAMLKMVKMNNKSTSCYEADMKEMYSCSLNIGHKPLDTHLREGILAITPVAQKIFTVFNF